MLGEQSPPDIPFIRFFTWDRPTISYGCNQNPCRRLYLDRCLADGIPVVKRPTGGRELLHGHDLCYCAVVPVANAISGVEAKRVFADISHVLVTALRGLGVDAGWSVLATRPRLDDGPCFAQADSGEITVAGRKLMASAQRIFPRCIIQQGSMPLSHPSLDLPRYLAVADIDTVRRRIEQSTAYLDEVHAEALPTEALVSRFGMGFTLFYGSPPGAGDELLERFTRNKS